MFCGLSPSNQAFVARLNADGSADNTFGANGIVMVVADNGEFYISGYQAVGLDDRGFVSRYYEDGSFYTSWAASGIAFVEITDNTTQLTDLELLNDGSIVAVGEIHLIASTTSQDILVVKLNPEGALDASFSVDGIVPIDYLGAADELKGILIQSDGKIVAVGKVEDDLANDQRVMLRLNANGSFDNTFGINGQVVSTTASNDQLERLLIQQDGKIVVCGKQGGFMLVSRYTSGLNVGIGQVNAYIGSTLIYPNPITNNSITVEYELKENEMVSIELFDVSGKQISSLQSPKEETAGSHQKTLSLPTLSAGNYLLKLNTEKGSVSVKLMVN